MTQPVLEVIVCSLSEALEAKKGGANRLEVVRDLGRGGLTPSWELVSEIKTAVDLPLRVMLRENVGYETSGEDEIRRLCIAAERFASVEVDGFVIGFLRDKRIDVELTQRVLACAPGLRATFHHAFEDARNQVEALRDIKCLLQVDRILSSGGVGGVKQRTERLASYSHSAAPELTIVAGGGIDSGVIATLKRTTGIREFHVGRAARSGFHIDGDVQAELVRNLVQVARG